VVDLHEFVVVREGAIPEEQSVAISPENRGGLVEGVCFDLLFLVRPVGPAASADAVLLVVPPQRESAEGRAGIVPYGQDAVAVQQLFDLYSVVHYDPFHGLILHDESTPLCPCPMGGICEPASNGKAPRHFPARPWGGDYAVLI